MSPAAVAYVGPGAGLSALGSVLALIGAAFLLFVGFLWYPIKRMLRRGDDLEQAAEGIANNDFAASDAAPSPDRDGSSNG